MIHALKYLVTCSICCAIFMAASATPASAQEASYKIGVVDMTLVLAQYNKRKAKYEELEKQVDALQQGVDQKFNAIEAAKKEFETKGKDWTPEERAARELKIKSDVADYQADLTKNQQKIDSMEEEVLKEVLNDVQVAIEATAKDGNYHLILNNRNGPNSAVLFADTTIDITSQVLARLNK